MSRVRRRRGYVLILLLGGGGLSVVNLVHATIEDSLPSLLVGGVFPTLTSLAVVGVGLWIWARGWSAERITRLAGWFLLGVAWMLVVGLGLTLYEYTEGTLPPDLGYLFAMFASYGAIPALLTGFYDIQRHEQARRAETRYAALKDESDFRARIEDIGEIGGWELDLRTDTIRWTEGGLDIHDFDGDATRDLETALKAYEGEDRRTLERALSQCRRDGAPFDLSLQMETADGTRRWVQVRGERDTMGGRPVIRGAIQDITRHMEREQRLMVLNRVLRHNIRNDLNVIAGTASMLRHTIERLDGPDGADAPTDPEELATQAATIERTADGIMRLAEKTQRFEAVIDKDVVVGMVAVGDVLAELVEEYRAAHPDVEVTADLADVSVPGNEEAVRLIFEELLENAIVHQDEDATVTVTVAQREHSVTISVADTGPGIPEMERAVLESGEETPLLHGSGIGLWIVDWLATRLDGAVTIRERDPRGTVVEVHLPTVSSGVSVTGKPPEDECANAVISGDEG